MAHQIHIFKTEWSSEDALSELSALLDNHPNVLRWHVDKEDIDKILKVETDSLTEKYIIELAQTNQIICEVLPD